MSLQSKAEVLELRAAQLAAVRAVIAQTFREHEGIHWYTDDDLDELAQQAVEAYEAVVEEKMEGEVEELIARSARCEGDRHVIPHRGCIMR